MLKITYDNIVEVLLEEFPEFKKSVFYSEIDKDLKYVIVGGFNSYLLDRLRSFSISDPVLQKGYKFINDLYNDQSIDPSERTGDTVQNIIFIEVFEALFDTEEGKLIAGSLFTGDARDEFDPTMVIYEDRKERLK